MSRYVQAGAQATVSVGVRDALSDAFLAGAIQSAARSRSDRRNEKCMEIKRHPSLHFPQICMDEGSKQLLAEIRDALPILPVPLLFPRICPVMIPTLLPETRVVALHKFQPIKPLGTLVSIQFRDNQAHRSTMIRL